MSRQRNRRRDFVKAAGLAAASLTLGRSDRAPAQEASSPIGEAFCVRPEELALRHVQPEGQRQVSFRNFKGKPQAWRRACRKKLQDLLGLGQPSLCRARRLRSGEYEGVAIEAWVMDVGDSLSIPAYLLAPPSVADPSRAVMAIHGHGQVEPCIGVRDDYHHAFALRLAQAGHLVLCPALRGFGPLADLAAGDEGRCVDYWASARGRQFTLVTDGFVHGKTLIGETVEDLLRWEAWLCSVRPIRTVDVAGISYGGDLALTYPVFSGRAGRIYASGTLGSFSVVFSRCYNAPAHCIPGILNWMDRSDIAGLNAPRPIRLHYGEQDTPGPHNNSASYNETVQPSLDELRAIYRAFNAGDQVSLRVTPGKGHEIDNVDLQAFLAT